MVYAIDFDGTLCEDAYPEIGAPREDVIGFCLAAERAGDKLILWTCRDGADLERAVEWCKERGIVFDAVNANLPELIAQYGNDPRKINADVYIDDRALSICFLGAIKKIVFGNGLPPTRIVGEEKSE